MAQTSISGETPLQIHRESLKTSRLPFLPTGAKHSALSKRQTSQLPEKRHTLHYPEKSLRPAKQFNRSTAREPCNQLPSVKHQPAACPPCSKRSNKQRQYLVFQFLNCFEIFLKDIFACFLKCIF